MLNGFTYHCGTLLLDGKPCGFKDNCGYLRVSISYKKYLVHRLIYKLHNPEFDLSSDLVIDHIDRNRLNNHIENLRAVTKGENNRNKAQPRGVSFCKQTGRWKAVWPVWLGRYDTEQEAIDAVINFTSKGS